MVMYHGIRGSLDGYVLKSRRLENAANKILLASYLIRSFLTSEWRIIVNLYRSMRGVQFHLAFTLYIELNLHYNFVTLFLF